jgi:3-phosphoshikimate 1-carboxyvinyltransferase
MQGDSQVSTIFKELGVVTEYLREDDGTKAVRLRKGNNLTCSLSCDLSSQPDLAQTIIVTAAMLDIPFTIGGLRTLRIKETDRIAALCRELGNLGLSIEDKGNDRMEWSGVWERSVELPEIATYEDHRMAMAFAPACLRMGGIRIMNPAVVSKSYPSYWEHLKNIGFKICS